METKLFTDELTDVTYISIFNNDGSVITMTKNHYDELEAQQVEHLTEIPTQEAQSL